MKMKPRFRIKKGDVMDIKLIFSIQYRSSTPTKRAFTIRYWYNVVDNKNLSL